MVLIALIRSVDYGPTVLSALVTDDYSRAAVAGVRALGLARIGVCVLSSTWWAPASSRHDSTHDLGPPSTDEQALVARIADPLPAAWICGTSGELVALLASVPPSEPLIVHERLAGSLEALSLVLAADGEVAACFASRALGLAPTSAGASRLFVSIAPTPRGWIGPAGCCCGWAGRASPAQFPRTEGGPALIDMNVRFCGSLPLATAAGVKLPAIWQRVASGGLRAPEPRYRLRVRCRSLEGEVVEARRGQVCRLATRPARGTVGAMWASDYPVPTTLLAVRATTPYRRNLIRPGARRVRGRSSAADG
jgi:hypothetical protein